MIVINENLSETEGSTMLFCPDNEFIGLINTHMVMLDVRRQIKKKGKEGYYFTYRNKQGAEIYIDITADGKLSYHPEGFFDVLDNLLDELI